MIPSLYDFLCISKLPIYLGWPIYLGGQDKASQFTAHILKLLHTATHCSCTYARIYVRVHTYSMDYTK